MAHIIVIGAGVIGASLAWHLARQGAQVTVIEALAPAAGASAKGFGWINASFSETPDYFRLRRAALQAWREVEAAAGPLARWGGSLWWEEEGAAFAAQLRHLQALGYPVEVLARSALRAREPQVADLPEQAIFAPDEGSADGAAVVARLLAGPGIMLRDGGGVLALSEGGGRITGVMTAQGPIAADGVVVAAGAGSAALLAPFGVTVPVSTKPGLIVETAPVGPVLNHLILAPAIHFRQGRDGRIVAGEIFSGDGPGAAQMAEDPQGLADEVMARLAARLPGVALRLERLHLGRRPVPADGLPIVGAVPGLAGLHLAVMHSGVTLAAVVGRELAPEVLGQGDSALLAPFRLSRFAG